MHQKNVKRTDSNVNNEEEIVEVIRDEYGVPHIFAHTVKGLYQTYGYVMAKDRLFQLEMFKRGNEGTVSEVLGSRYLERDQKMRRDGYSDSEISKMINEMDDFSQNALCYFTKGISMFVKEAVKEPDSILSKEFHDLDIKPKGWNEIDVFRLFLSSQMVFMDQEQEIINASLLENLLEKFGEVQGLAMFNDIFWVNDIQSPPTTLKADCKTEDFDVSGNLNKRQLPKGIKKVANHLLERRKRFEKQSKEILSPLTIGSYAVVVAPEKSLSKNPLLLGGPQAGFTAPGFLYEVGLHGPGIDITGSSFIGYPFIMFGTTKDITFTSTAGYGNVVDIFIEELHPENCLKYKFNDMWHDMEQREEKFFVKDEAGNIVEESTIFYRTKHGPVIYIDKENNVAYSKAWTFRGTEAQTWASNLQTNWTNNVDEFVAAAQKGTLSLNRFVADKKGNIAYYHAGSYPIREKRIDVRLPTPGTGEYEWKGFYDRAKNPYEKNPENYFFANWNNKPAPEWHNGELCFNWGMDHRVQQYNDLLMKAKKLTLEKLDGINYHASLVVLRTKGFKPLLLDSIERSNTSSSYKEIIESISEWNNLAEDNDQDGLYDHPALTIFEEWWSILYNKLFKVSLEELHEDFQPIIDHHYGCSLALKILQGDKTLHHKWMDDEDKDLLINKSFHETLMRLERKFKTKDYKQWLTPVRKMKFGGSSIIGIPHGCGSNKEVQEMNRGSENHYVELTEDGPVGFNITPPGHIGFISKSGEVNDHYVDQVNMYEKWEYKPIHIERTKILENMKEKEQVFVPNN